MNKKSLNTLRIKIDEIDHNLLQLFEDRMQIVTEVKKLKESKGEKLFIRPDREFNMIKNLAERSSGKLSSHFIFDIWRKIISYSNFLEQDLKIDLFNPQSSTCYKYILRDFYNRKFPINDNKNDFSQSLQKLKNNKIHIIIANLFEKKSNTSCWWVDLFLKKTTDIRIFTAVSPRIVKENIQLFSIGKVAALPSKHDKTIFAIKADEGFSRPQNFNISLLNSVTIKNDRFYLFEVDGFYLDDYVLSNKINPIGKLKILGHYPIL